MFFIHLLFSSSRFILLVLQKGKTPRLWPVLFLKTQMKTNNFQLVDQLYWPDCHWNLIDCGKYKIELPTYRCFRLFFRVKMCHANLILFLDPISSKYWRPDYSQLLLGLLHWLVWKKLLYCIWNLFVAVQKMHLYLNSFLNSTWRKLQNSVDISAFSSFHLILSIHFLRVSREKKLIWAELGRRKENSIRLLWNEAKMKEKVEFGAELEYFSVKKKIFELNGNFCAERLLASAGAKQ